MIKAADFNLKTLGLLCSGPEAGLAALSPAELRDRAAGLMDLFGLRESTKAGENFFACVQKVSASPVSLGPRHEAALAEYALKQGKEAVRHPLQLTLQDSPAISPKEQRRALDEELRKLAGLGKESPQRLFLALWRILPAFLKKIPAWERLPARRAEPALSVWELMDQGAALVSALDIGADGETRDLPALLEFRVEDHAAFLLEASSIEELSNAARILSELIWHAMEPLVEAYGPDAVLLPALFADPLCDEWLRRQLPAEWANSVRSNTVSNLRSGFVALVPSSQAEEMGATCRERFDSAWRDLSEKVRGTLHGTRLSGFEAQVKRALKPCYTVTHWPEGGAADLKKAGEIFSDLGNTKTLREFESLNPADGKTRVTLGWTLFSHEARARADSRAEACDFTNPRSSARFGPVGTVGSAALPDEKISAAQLVKRFAFKDEAGAEVRSGALLSLACAGWRADLSAHKLPLSFRRYRERLSPFLAAARMAQPVSTLDDHDWFLALDPRWYYEAGFDEARPEMAALPPVAKQQVAACRAALLAFLSELRSKKIAPPPSRYACAIVSLPDLRKDFWALGSLPCLSALHPQSAEALKGQIQSAPELNYPLTPARQKSIASLAGRAASAALAAENSSRFRIWAIDFSSFLVLAPREYIEGAAREISASAESQLGAPGASFAIAEGELSAPLSEVIRGARRLPQSRGGES